MTEEEMFAAYVQNFDIHDLQIALKVRHTWQVVKAADAIAQSLNLTGHQKQMVHLAALYHDLGRFEQIRQFHTFLDAKSVDHALLSARLLESGSFLDHVDRQTREQIIEAVRVHSMVKIPEEHSGWQRVLDGILRDADKVDIFRVTVDDDPVTVSGYSLEEAAGSYVSDISRQRLENHTSILRSERQTPLDFWVSYLGFIWDLQNPQAARLILDQGYWKQPLETILSLPAMEPETRDVLERLLEDSERGLCEKAAQIAE